MTISFAQQTADFFLVEAESVLRGAAIVFDDRPEFDRLIKYHSSLMYRVDRETEIMQLAEKHNNRKGD